MPVCKLTNCTFTSIILIFHKRCIPDKDTETCYYLDPSAAKETNLKQDQEEKLAEIPEVPKGRE